MNIKFVVDQLRYEPFITFDQVGILKYITINFATNKNHIEQF